MLKKVSSEHIQMPVCLAAGPGQIQGGGAGGGHACQPVGQRHRHHCHMRPASGAHGALLEPLCKPCWTPLLPVLDACPPPPPPGWIAYAWQSYVAV